MDSDTRQNRIVEFALKVLAGRRLLKRVHGGAVPLETAAFESGVEYRSQVDLAQKHRIAAEAAKLLHGAETVYLDEGFTPRLIAERLAEQELTVVTSSLLAAEALAHSSTVTVLLLGGRMRGRTLATVTLSGLIAAATPGARRRARSLGRAAPRGWRRRW